MDVVRANIEKFGGSLEVWSRPGEGTQLLIRVPLTLSILPSLTVGCGGQTFAIPRSCVEEIVSTAGDRLELALAVTAGERPMPASLGWHPWFRKPLRLQFDPEAMYPRDEDGITRLPPGPVAPGPWDDCFVNHRDVVLQRADVRVVVSSDCTDWVVYDATAHATCVEPQTAPPDAFNLDASPALAPGQTLAMRCELRWEPV